ncbi:MAG TPA: hypothetical protein VGP48_07450 [Stellaceae bacterium]|jgi:hypothetical protein|nr:hypothetical protein [Stellaceae bacterium]
MTAADCLTEAKLPMAWYRAYFINRKRRICDVQEFRSDSDEQALTEAHDMLAQRAHLVAVELWQEARPVFLDLRGVAEAGAAPRVSE